MSDCAICLECIDTNIENKIKTTECNHTFHSNCFETWIKVNNSCPLCRKAFTTIPIINNTIAYVPLQFWFSRNPNLAIPLVSSPFALHPESNEPSGFVNFNRINIR